MIINGRQKRKDISYLNSLILIIAFLAFSESFSQWVDTNCPIEWGYDVQDFTFSGNNLYVGTYHDGVFRTSDNGYHWLQINNGLTNTDIRALASNDTSLFAGSFGNGVFYSNNAGENWITANFGIENSRIIALSLNDNYLFASDYDTGLFRSSDNGNSWTQINNGLGYHIVYSLKANNSALFAGTSDGLYISTNNGDLWIARNNGLELCQIHCLINIDSLIIVGTAGTLEISEGIYRSTDYGNTWSNVYPEAGSFGSMANYDTNVIAGSEFGIFISTDLGINWRPFSKGIVYIEVISTFLFINSYIFGGTILGKVYRRPYSQITSIDEESKELFSNFELSQNYPNPFNLSTTISYQIPGREFVSLKVYDILGREIATLVNEEKPAGSYEMQFTGNGLTSGIYFYKLKAGNYSETKKMILIR